MIAALPRKKANGDVNIRAIRTGTSSLMRVAFCFSRTVTGSGRSRALRNSAWDERGTLRRSAFPFAIRSARDKRMALKLPSLASSAGLALDLKKSSSLGIMRDPAPFRGVAVNVARQRAGFDLSQFTKALANSPVSRSQMQRSERAFWRQIASDFMIALKFNLRDKTPICPED
ncbi:MAG: hypothetical protein ACJ8EF_01820 [Bradyrhizobium sp.]